MQHPDPNRPASYEEWEAVAAYADGTEQRRRFWMPAGSTEPEAKHRAWTIWTLARMGEGFNPTLRVHPVEAEERAEAA